MNQYKFIWKGKDPQGSVRSEEVMAENAQAAREELTRRGWAELELVFDEIATASGAGVEAPDWITEEGVSAQQLTEQYEGKAPGFLAQWFKGLLDSKKSLLIFGAFLAWGIYTDRKWAWIIGAIGLGFIVLLMPALHAFFSVTLRQYSRLNKAKVWGRWNEVLDCVERLRKAHRLTRIGVGDLELARCRAQALAALGRLDEGVKEFRQFENSPKVERWLYLSHLSSIYDEAKAFDKSLECRQQAAAEKPDSSAVWIDLAYGHVRGFNQPTKAREALAKAEAHEITGLGKAYVPFVRGIICWRERNFAEARKHLEEALTGLQPLAHHDLVVGLILLTKSYLCAVDGASGNLTEARRLFRETKEFLKAHREEELFQACRSGV
jgi:tetratricopeptide (TPR) repeat protein